MGRNGTKYFSDRLEPMFRFLDKQVGRRWDDVWSEISKVVPANGTMQIHARNHVFDFVEVNCRRGADGRVYAQGEYGIQPLSDGWRRQGLYVVPESGRLARVPAQKRRRHTVSPEAMLAGYRDGTCPYPLEDGLFLQRFQGVWFFVRFKTEWVGYREVKVVSEKRQLSKKEIRDSVPAELGRPVVPRRHQVRA